MSLAAIFSNSDGHLAHFFRSALPNSSSPFAYPDCLPTYRTYLRPKNRFLRLGSIITLQGNRNLYDSRVTEDVAALRNKRRTFCPFRPNMASTAGDVKRKRPRRPGLPLRIYGMENLRSLLFVFGFFIASSFIPSSTGVSFGSRLQKCFADADVGLNWTSICGIER